jgi:hypothetical protein
MLQGMSFFQAKLISSWLYAVCKEGKRDEEVLRERMGVAVDEEGRKSRRRRQNPLQQHSSRARERERERDTHTHTRLYTTLAVPTAVGCLSSKRYAAKQAHPK